MINLITSRFATATVFAISGITAAGMAVALASLLSADPKGPDATGRVVALLACTSLSGTCLALAAGAATDAD